MFNKKLKQRLAELENLLGYVWSGGSGYFTHEQLTYGKIKQLEDRIKDLEKLSEQKK